MLAVALAGNLGRWGMVAAKYGYLSPTEYAHILTNTRDEMQMRDLQRLQLLTSWATPTAEFLEDALDASVEVDTRLPAAAVPAPI